MFPDGARLDQTFARSKRLLRQGSQHLKGYDVMWVYEDEWSRMIQDDPGWSRMIQDDPGWSRMIQDDPGWSNPEQASLHEPSTWFTVSDHRAVWRLAWLQPLHLEHPESQSESLIQLDCKTGELRVQETGDLLTVSYSTGQSWMEALKNLAIERPAQVLSTKQQHQLTRKPSIFIHQMEWMFGLIVPHLKDRLGMTGRHKPITTSMPLRPSSAGEVSSPMHWLSGSTLPVASCDVDLPGTTWKAWAAWAACASPRAVQKTADTAPLFRLQRGKGGLQRFLGVVDRGRTFWARLSKKGRQQANERFPISQHQPQALHFKGIKYVSGMFLSIAAFSMHMFGTSQHQFLLPQNSFPGTSPKSSDPKQHQKARPVSSTCNVCFSETDVPTALWL